MNNAGFQTADYVIFVLYALMIVGLGLWLSRTKKGEEKDTKDYFLAGGTLLQMAEHLLLDLIREIVVQETADP